MVPSGLCGRLGRLVWPTRRGACRHQKRKRSPLPPPTHAHAHAHNSAYNTSLVNERRRTEGAASQGAGGNKLPRPLTVCPVSDLCRTAALAGRIPLRICLTPVWTCMGMPGGVSQQRLHIQSLAMATAICIQSFAKAFCIIWRVLLPVLGAFWACLPPV